jgi:hypothetical protein
MTYKYSFYTEDCFFTQAKLHRFLPDFSCAWQAQSMLGDDDSLDFIGAAANESNK